MRQQDRWVWELLRSALYDRPFREEEGQSWTEILRELRAQSVALIPADKLREVPLTEQQRKGYAYFVGQQMNFWNRLMFCQQSIVLALREASIHVAVLKGAAAAMYYPKPEYRSMGDIDLIVGPEDFDRALMVLLEIGCEQMTFGQSDEREKKSSCVRHETLDKNGIHIELHRYFSTKKAPEDVSYLDECIYDNLSRISWKELGGYTFPVLPALQNGLVLLQHISQHLESGLGLRQILDWMLYVEQELTDEVWEKQFAQEADRIGLRRLAVVVTRMCQIYLGLSPEITWCTKAEKIVCSELMEYIMNHGNFGRKDVMSSRTVAVLYNFRNPFSILKLAQTRGCINWKILEKYPYLKPFAWIYQLGRWARKGMRRESAGRGLAEDIKKAVRQDGLLDDLGVRRNRIER